MARMTHSQIPPDRVRRLQAVVARQRRYLEKLLSRMHQLHFPPDDALRLSAERAAGAVASLDDVLTVISSSK
jgi:hypothetical protein